jgi:hypothetical protein
MWKAISRGFDVDPAISVASIETIVRAASPDFAFCATVSCAAGLTSNAPQE